MEEVLLPFVNYPIDWDLTPEHAVTMYLEWGNNDWDSKYGPVTSKNDVSHYFVVDTWDGSPIIRLVKRNSEGAEDLVSFPLPPHLLSDFKEEYGTLKGIFTPYEPVKAWLREMLGQ